MNARITSKLTGARGSDSIRLTEFYDNNSAMPDVVRARLLRENSMFLETTITELYRRVAAGELHSIGELNVTMTSLEIGQSVLTRIPTWPWRSGTLRGLVSALLLPLVVFVLQYVLQRFLFS